ncbi:hypothetical protein [Skermania piniformis]|uniref:Uncharacterized protein n=1 Tax=Skermania pinensis TaxID=39122 RepID=A0ABX8SBB9_9ACTN|nr:hypothetical protein [Skermania piniformis]QXQ15149.1 hypothetical protein KV203_07345 [Skermania piniformis]
MSSNDRPARLSYTKLAGFSLGAAAAVLMLTTAIIGVLHPGPVVALVIALAGVVGAVGALGVVATRLTRAAHGPDPGSGRAAE